MSEGVLPIYVTNGSGLKKWNCCHAEMTNLTILLSDRSFQIPKKPVIENCELFDAYPELYDEPSYEIQSDVDPEDCASFVNFIQSRDASMVTPDNCRALRELAGEFGDSHLLEICAEMEEAQDHENMAVRVSALEDSVSQSCEEREILERDFPRNLCEFVVSKLTRVSEEIRALRKETEGKFSAMSSQLASSQAEIEYLRGSLRSELREAVRECKSQATEGIYAASEVLQRKLEAVRVGVTWLTKTVEPLMKKVQCPLKEDKSAEGMISHLTKKHDGNVHEKGVVTLTSSSIYEDNPKCAAKHVADLVGNYWFMSGDQPDQWVCWDFGQMRVRPTHYTMRAVGLKSWIVAGSLDGESWVEIHRQTNSQTFKERNQASFAFGNTDAFRFLRLIQTDKTHGGNNILDLRLLEFFGTLYE
jgi:hypothetical protein